MRLHSMSSKPTSRNSTQQAGFVSIIVTMIIMVLLSLIVLGFSKVSRREQQQGLDRQLASQAQYAAESGINDAQNFIKKNGLSLSSTANTVCNSYDPATNKLPKNGGDPTLVDNVVNSCVLVDPTVTDLVYDKVDTASEVIVPLQLATGGSISTINISWQDSSSASQDYAQCQSDPAVNLSPNTTWTCPAGVLRVDIVAGTTLSRTALLNSDKGLLLVPQQNNTGNTINLPALTNSADIRGIACTAGAAPRACTANITVTATPKYYLRIRPVYRSADLNINVNAGVSRMIGAQAIVDSTGRANDVLKRLVARIPTCASGQVCGKQPAGFALQSAGTICKRYGVIPANGSKPAEISVGDVDPSCALP